MKNHLNLLMIITVLLTFLMSNQILAVPGGGKDFSITNLRVDIPSGNVYARVKNGSTVPFTGDVYFGIWFKGKMKRPVKRKLIFTTNRQYEIILCNHSHLQSMMGDGFLKVKADVTNQYVEVNEKNNFFNKHLYFYKITHIALNYAPGNLTAWIKKGEIQKYIFKAKFKIVGRGLFAFKYYRIYNRSLIKQGQMGKRRLNSSEKGPYIVNVKLGSVKYRTEIVEERWNKIVSFDINARNREVHERSYKIKAIRPNPIESNKVFFKSVYMK